MSQQDRLTIEALNLNSNQSDFPISFSGSYPQNPQNSAYPVRPRRRRRPEARPPQVNDSVSMSHEARREDECDSGVCANFLAAWS